MRIAGKGCGALVGLLGAVAPGIAAESLDVRPEILGGYPLCEASAAISLGGNRIVVGDNTVGNALFSFDIEDRQLKFVQRVKLLQDGDDEICDIEALTMLENGDVMVFGSHGRNAQCQPMENCRRFLRGQLTNGGFEPLGEGVVTVRETISCSGLFDDAPTDDESIRASVCRRVDAAKQTADDICAAEWSDDKKTEACRKSPPFNVEGAVAVPNDRHEAVWVGLRSPLLSSPLADCDNDMAILLQLRCPDCDEFKFTAAALVDLGGSGIRGLTFSEGWVFGVAGPSDYGNGEFKVWKFRSDKLKPEAVIKPKYLASFKAQTSPEGLVIIGSTAHIFFDGERGAETCKQPAGHFALQLSH